MISRLKGTLVHRTTERVEIETAAGIVYEAEVPLTVGMRLPAPGERVELRTLQVVREDSAALYGFLDAGERELFRRLLGATGVGAKLALAMLSTYTAHRLARILVQKDAVALRQVSGVGPKTAERIVLELADKVTDLAAAGGEDAADGAESGVVQAAVAALVSLGYAFTDAETAVRDVLSREEVTSADELIRKALQAK